MPESPESPQALRRWWLIGVSSAVAVAAVIAIVVVLIRPGDDTTPPALALPSIVASQFPPAPSPTPSAQVTPTAAEASAATQSRSATPATTHPSSTAPTARTTTRITAPANGARIAWAVNVRFTLSPADLTATATVVTVSICVSGRCYLDGAIKVENGKPVPDPVHLGSTQAEGTGIGWTLRVDRLSKATYAGLTAEREAEIADSSWGNKGTSMNKLNPTPVSTVTVTKTG